MVSGTRARWWAFFAVLALLVSQAGCDTSGRSRIGGEGRDTLEVGVIAPLTGPIGYIGQDLRLGIELASRDRPAESMPLVKFLYEDSQGNAPTAISGLRKLLDLQDVRFQIVAGTAPVLATLPAYAQSGRPVLVIAESMVPAVAQAYPFAYQLFPSADEETDVLSAHAAAQGYRRVGILYMRNQIGEDAARLFETKFAALQGAVPLKESFTSGDANHRTTLAKFRDQNLDALFVFGYSTDYALILPQIQEAGLSMPILGGINVALGDVEKQLDRSLLENVAFTVPAYYYARGDSALQAFVAKVRARGADPNFNVAFYYDMTRILFRAVESADSITPTAVGRAIERAMPFRGVTGTLTLGPNRDLRTQMRMARWGPGGIEVIPARTPAEPARAP